MRHAGVMGYNKVVLSIKVAPLKKLQITTDMLLKENRGKGSSWMETYLDASIFRAVDRAQDVVTLGVGTLRSGIFNNFGTSTADEACMLRSLERSGLAEARFVLCPVFLNRHFFLCALQVRAPVCDANAHCTLPEVMEKIAENPLARHAHYGDIISKIGSFLDTNSATGLANTAFLLNSLPNYDRESVGATFARFIDIAERFYSHKRGDQTTFKREIPPCPVQPIGSNACGPATTLFAKMIAQHTVALRTGKTTMASLFDPSKFDNPGAAYSAQRDESNTDIDNLIIESDSK